MEIPIGVVHNAEFFIAPNLKAKKAEGWLGREMSPAIKSGTAQWKGGFLRAENGGGGGNSSLCASSFCAIRGFWSSSSSSLPSLYVARN